MSIFGLRPVLLILIALSSWTATGIVVAESRTPAFSSDPAAVKSRLDNVRRLVTTSSGARRIIEGSDDKAKTLRGKAESHLDAAEIAYDKGNMDATQSELELATEQMFSAVRHIGTGKEGVDKRVRDFDNKAKSVDVLLNAIDRVATEKGGKADVKRRAALIRDRARSAQSLADKRELVAARELLDRVYEEAKNELEQLREGDTLVRTLEFASAEEEYHYELDRNDTHQMLLKVLISDQAKRPGAQQLIDRYSDQSKQLRAQAESEAAQGAFERAVKSLEQATQYLQRAIRSAGVYIPG